MEENQNSKQIICFLKDKADKLNRKRENYRKAIRSIGINTFFSILGVSVTFPIVDYLSKYFSFNEPLITALTGSIGIGAVLYKAKMEKRDNRINNPAIFYLYQLSKKLK